MMTERKISYVEAINEGLAEEMRRDPNIIYYGQTVGRSENDPFLVEFGGDRVKTTPILETAEAGIAIGAALTGLRPVADLGRTDFAMLAMDQLLNQAPRLRFCTGGQVGLPIVYKMSYGSASGWSVHHSNCWHNMFMNAQGSKLVMPSMPYDAKGLIKTSLRESDPVFFLTCANITTFKGQVPKEEYTIPFGIADIKRSGKDVTIVAMGWMVHLCLTAAEELSRQGVDVEVIDPRTLVPLDKKTILDSVEKTSHLVIVDQAPKTGSVSGEIAAIVADEGFDDLKAPIKRVCGLDTSIGYSRPIEEFPIPRESDIVKAVMSIAEK